MSRNFNRLALTPDHQLEPLAEARRNEVEAMLATHFNFGPPLMQQAYRAGFTRHLKSPVFISKVGEALLPVRLITNEAIAVTHHGYRAGLDIAAALVENPKPDRAGYLNAVGSGINNLRTAHISENTNAYLETRPNIEGLLMEVAMRICKTEDRMQLFRSCGAFACLLVEMTEEKRHLQHALDKLDFYDPAIVAMLPKN